MDVSTDRAIKFILPTNRKIDIELDIITTAMTI